jgi:hypothetical protein
LESWNGHREIGPLLLTLSLYHAPLNAGIVYQAQACRLPSIEHLDSPRSNTIVTLFFPLSWRC